MKKLDEIVNLFVIEIKTLVSAKRTHEIVLDILGEEKRIGPYIITKNHKSPLEGGYLVKNAENAKSYVMVIDYLPDGKLIIREAFNNHMLSYSRPTEHFIRKETLDFIRKSLDKFYDLIYFSNSTPKLESDIFPCKNFYMNIIPQLLSVEDNFTIKTTIKNNHEQFNIEYKDKKEGELHCSVIGETEGISSLQLKISIDKLEVKEEQTFPIKDLYDITPIINRFLKENFQIIRLIT